MSNNVAELERELNEMVASGQAIDTFERLYAEEPAGDGVGGWSSDARTSVRRRTGYSSRSAFIFCFPNI